jgi:hypothetical protein
MPLPFAFSAQRSPLEGEAAALPALGTGGFTDGGTGGGAFPQLGQPAPQPYVGADVPIPRPSLVPHAPMGSSAAPAAPAFPAFSPVFQAPVPSFAAPSAASPISQVLSAVSQHSQQAHHEQTHVLSPLNPQALATPPASREPDPQVREMAAQIEQLRSDLFAAATNISALHDRLGRLEARPSASASFQADLITLRADIERWINHHLDAAVEQRMRSVWERAQSHLRPAVPSASSTPLSSPDVTSGQLMAS